jgi:hypothetical protein
MSWLWALKIACGAGLLACRFGYIGWRRFSWRRAELWFGLACLAEVLAVIRLQGR